MTCFCGKPLTEKQRARGSRFCSRACANSYRYRDVKREYICQGCGKPYIKKNSGTKIGTKYCGSKCGRMHNLGRKFTAEHKKKIADGQKNIRVQGAFECERCGEDFESNTSLRAHKAHCHHDRLLLRCYNCGREFKGVAGLQRHHIWCISTDENKKARKDIKTGVRAGNIRRLKAGIGTGQNTKPEIRMRKWLEKRGITFDEQFNDLSISNHCYDFLIEGRLVVEVDGDYWHGNPKKFVLTPNQKRQYHIDTNYTLLARRAGYNVIRYWESDIMTRIGKVMDDIERVLMGSTAELARDL